MFLLMANTIKIRRSTSASSVPTTTQLSEGELALNVYDGKLFFKKVQSGTESIVTLQEGGASGITSLNSQTGATQTFAVGTSGNDVAFSSSSNTHTLNVPDASTTARGLVTTGAQSFTGAKTLVQPDANTVGFTLKAAASPVAAVMSVVDSTGATTYSYMDGFGRWFGRPAQFSSFAANTAAVLGIAGVATAPCFIARGASSQSAHLMQFQDSTQAVVANMDVRGNLTLNTNKRCGGPTSGTNSVALGRNALNASLSGADANTAVGDYAGAGITSGYRSTCIGYGANAGTSGYGNTAIGYNSGGSITTSFENTYLGQNAGDTSTGSRNVFVGYYAGISGATVGAGRVTVVGYAAKAQGDYALAIGENASAAANSCVVRWGNANRINGDSNGQVGVNEATPGGQLQVTSGAAARKALLIKGAASQSANLLEVQDSAATAKAYTRADGSQVVSLAATDTNAGITSIVTNNGYTCLGLWQQASTAGGVSQYLAAFYNASIIVGSITHNGSSTAFNTSSDYRLKENLVPLSNPVSRLGALPVYRFNFKSDPTRTVDGCLAHEVAQCVPEAVVGQKDGTAPDGSILPQAVDYSKLVPLLVASVQELSAEVASLKARVAVLEGA